MLERLKRSGVHKNGILKIRSTLSLVTTLPLKRAPRPPLKRSLLSTSHLELHQEADRVYESSQPAHRPFPQGEAPGTMGFLHATYPSTCPAVELGNRHTSVDRSLVGGVGGGFTAGRSVIFRYLLSSWLNPLAWGNTQWKTILLVSGFRNQQIHVLDAWERSVGELNNLDGAGCCRAKTRDTIKR